MLQSEGVAPPLLPTAQVRISPSFRKLSPPVIVIGMHRSGTSMVAGMLSMIGVFMDPDFPFGSPGSGMAPGSQLRSDGYGESTAFRLLNEAIMARADANWFDVDPFLAQRDRPLFARSSIARLQLATYGSLFRDHIGQHLDAAGGRWGWKDPRTSLTLSYWLQLFPHARLVHVRRSDEAIVNSLLRRAAQPSAGPPSPPHFSERAGRLFRSPAQLVNAVGRRAGLKPAPSVTSASLLDRSFCHDLVKRYVGECLRYRGINDRYLEVCYEDVLRDPAATVNRIADFAEISPTLAERQAAVALVSRDDNLSKGSGLPANEPDGK